MTYPLGHKATCVGLHNFCQSQNDEYVDYDHILDELIRKERLIIHWGSIS